MILSSIFLWLLIALGHRLTASRLVYLLCVPGSVPMACASIPTSPTQSFWALTSVLRTFPAIPAVKIADTDINISNEITSLGVIMDSKLTLDSHISAIGKSCYYHLRSLRHIRRSLTQDMAISVAVAIVQSRLDYCNSLLSDISTFNINKLQRVQNLAARLALNDWHSPSHVLVSKLHWLPVLSRIKFKISSLTYKLLNDHQPGYLSSLISLYTPVRSLRSSNMSLLTQPLARLSIGRRAFSVCAPQLWNNNNNNNEFTARFVFI